MTNKNGTANNGQITASTWWFWCSYTLTLLQVREGMGPDFVVSTSFGLSYCVAVLQDFEGNKASENKKLEMCEWDGAVKGCKIHRFIKFSQKQPGWVMF